MNRAFPFALIFTLLIGCTERHEQDCDPPCIDVQQECVDGVCRDRNCDPPCRGGRVCVRGFCVRACDPDNPSTCGHDETCCEHLRACVNTDTDFYNCGACAQACPTVRSNICTDARCGCQGWSASACQEGFGCCPDTENPERNECKDLMADPENCGACGHSCGGLQCVDGECRCSTDEPCPEGETCCPNGCRNTQTDSQNCGECGRSCEAGEDCCDGECVNTLVADNHCGACGNSCGGSETCCIGSCTNTNTDVFNCGDCFVDCGEGGRCVDGDCE